jgi:hypothetical protein
MGHRREHPVDCLDWAHTKGAYRFSPMTASDI